VRILADRSPVPVEIRALPRERLPPPIETAIYFVVAEALTNVAKYAHATTASVSIAVTNGRVAVEVSDDGAGGADVNAGSGLRGLADRVAALDGDLEIASTPGHGTRLHAEIPL
jgi:signal transduction histidine kinase